MEIKNAIIESVSLDMGDRGLLTAWLHLKYERCGQGFGGYALYLPKAYAHHKIDSVAGHFIFRCMEVAGVERWDDLTGKAIRVKATNGGVESIGHIINNDWFTPSEDFKTQD